MPTAKGIIKTVAGKAAKAALKKENDAIPSSASAIEKNMETLKQTLLNKSEGARIAKLRSLGYKAEEAAKILKEMNLPIAGRSSKSGTSVLMKDQIVPYTKPLFN
jgi:Skp family chaperone for outer membrane proteins